MSRKGVWGLQGVRDKYLKSLWVQEKKLWALGGPSSLNHSKQFGNPDDADPASARSSSGNNAGAKDWDTMSVSNFDNQHLYYKEMGTDDWYVMGRNVYGSLGMNQGPGPFKEDKPIAYPAGSGKTWGMFASSRDATIAVKTDGTLWAWGENEYGQTGNNRLPNTTSGVSSPMQIPGTWDTTDLGRTGTRESNMAIDSQGNLYAMGRNDDGELGQNNRTNRSSPVQIPGSWKAVRGAHDAVLAIKTDGTLWGWGKNQYGEIGKNQTATQWSSPTQIGTDSTWGVLGNSSFTFMAGKT